VAGRGEGQHDVFPAGLPVDVFQCQPGPQRNGVALAGFVRHVVPDKENRNQTGSDDDRDVGDNLDFFAIFPVFSSGIGFSRQAKDSTPTSLQAGLIITEAIAARAKVFAGVLLLDALISAERVASKRLLWLQHDNANYQREENQ
jgi:hypothetical protein